MAINNSQDVIDTIQNNIAYLFAFIALLGYAAVIKFTGSFTALPTHGASGLFSTTGEFYSFDWDATTYVVTWAMGLSIVGIVGAYMSDPVTGDMAFEKLSPAEFRARIDEAALELAGASLFLIVPAVKLFDVGNLWTDFAGTTTFSVAMMVLGTVGAVAVVYLD
ncbi:hypothetical protein [Haloarchaeobius litoreus]|uniref:Uncharacterized protein n=1 Tax=Haloarchaeobius litoreus TaxID=755306 RepID=A0ABD6DKS4_9EURY|nr:hypothetical protein [Haloarchaeobius litoreus]